ncbi:AtpZ/AtpI family protein [Rheinheimera sp. UJ63]|uniref:AtpZ/AtpI family protein n=1 Tax=Rheinheimera sp. UJ63 TaxID=2910157 RepID=UPI001F3D2DA1|nr:AtpZ/AtpI family protein [Rheinheimera sp. UJ63]MCF4008690.1 AtpZ/AtpI family protein [Rheinheimera sp. UJ63]
MTKHESSEEQKQQQALLQQVHHKAKRKLKAQRSQSGVWFGLGMMGLIGWSIAVPTLLGTALGMYLDDKLQDQRSWTLALLLAGLVIGCFTAWQWLNKEGLAMHQEKENDDE